MIPPPPTAAAGGHPHAARGACVLALGLVIGAGMWACRAGGPGSEPSARAPATIPSPPDEVLASVLEGYRHAYARVAEGHLSAVHWDQRIAIYISSGADIYQRNYAQFLALKDDPDQAPDFAAYPLGTVVVKEQRHPLSGDQHEAQSWCLMIKEAAGRGDGWRYVEVDRRRGVVLDGHADVPAVQERCATCHAEAEDSDFVFSSYFDAQVAGSTALGAAP